MPNTYSPPPTINFFSPATFASSLVYFNTQAPASNLSFASTVSSSYGIITAYTPNSITIPVAGDYIVSWHTGAYTNASFQRVYYRCQFTKSGLTTTVSGGTLSSGATTVTVTSTAGFLTTGGWLKIDSEEILYTAISGNTFTGCSRAQNGTTATTHSNGATVTFAYFVGDLSTHIYFPTASTSVAGSFFGKVSFPSSGVWTLTPGWKSDSTTSNIQAGSTYYPWTVSIHGMSAFDAVNQQQTQYLDANYTLMTNMDTNAFWGSQTTTNIINNTNNVSANTSSITSLSNSVNNLTTQVNTLSSAVSGLTSTAVTSGGIRVKP